MRPSRRRRKNPELDTRTITGVPTFTPTVGNEPWELTLAELDRFQGEGPSSSFSLIAPPNTQPLPPVGAWRVDPILRYVEQLQELPIGSVGFTEDVNDPSIRRSVEAYIDYYEQGLEPLPGNVVWNEATQRLVTVNRRRVLAALMAGRKTFKAWVGGDKYEEVVERARAAGLPVAARRANPARAGRDEYESREVREMRDGHPYYTTKSAWTSHPPYLTEGHFDLEMVQEAAAIASRAKAEGTSLGRGNFGEAFRLDTSRGPVVVKIAAEQALYGNQQVWTRDDQQRNLMHEAGVANELSEMGYTIVPQTVYVELDDGTPALVREYGEPARLTPEDFYELEQALMALERETLWRVQDDLLVMRRPDGSLFIADVGIWQSPTVKQEKVSKPTHSSLDGLLRTLAKEAFGADITSLPRIMELAEAVSDDRRRKSPLFRELHEMLRKGVRKRDAAGLPTPDDVRQLIQP